MSQPNLTMSILLAPVFPAVAFEEVTKSFVLIIDGSLTQRAQRPSHSTNGLVHTSRTSASWPWPLVLSRTSSLYKTPTLSAIHE